MYFEIVHSMTYTYEPRVFLEPMTVRLRPRCDCTQRLLHHAVTVTPSPAGGCDNIDLDGNGVSTYWFEGKHDSLKISAVSKVETVRIDPFNFLLNDPKARELPFAYPQHLEVPLRPYCSRVQRSSEVDAFARALQNEVKGATLPFLSLLAERISTSCEHVIRDKGEPMSPVVTLTAERAACRDLVVLAMDICRAVGLATRFVSGYQQSDEGKARRHLHAWFEVYLPGAGWRGYDPTGGLAVADRHVALCAAADPHQAAPARGTFRGTGASSRLEYELTIKADSEAS
jgi:transglutaminase-like putative cysteine protease